MMYLCKYCDVVGEDIFSSEQIQFFDIFSSEAYLKGDKFFVHPYHSSFKNVNHHSESLAHSIVQRLYERKKKMNSKNKLYASVTLLSLLLLVGCAADDDTASSDSSAVRSSEMVESSSEATSMEESESLTGEIQESDIAESEAASTVNGYGAVGALADNDLTMEEMFTYAIQDEHLAHGEYAYTLASFGDQAPFNNIVSSEAQHIAEMTVLFEKYGLTVPADESADHLHPVADVKEALETCVAGEVDNIAMYNKFLEQDIPDDVRATFTALRNASEGHLQAFRKSLEKY